MLSDYCPDCNGRGIRGDEHCETCDGTGSTTLQSADAFMRDYAMRESERIEQERDERKRLAAWNAWAVQG